MIRKSHEERGNKIAVDESEIQSALEAAITMLRLLTRTDQRKLTPAHLTIHQHIVGIQLSEFTRAYLWLRKAGVQIVLLNEYDLSQLVQHLKVRISHHWHPEQINYWSKPEWQALLAIYCLPDST